MGKKSSVTSTCDCCTETKSLSELSAGFYNCFYLSVAKAEIHSLCGKGLTTVFTTEMHPFILISDGRLAIDYSSYGNLSDHQNLCLHSLSHLSLDLIFLNDIN